MATPKPLEFYPRGQLSLGAGGRLNQVTDLSVTADNGAKLKHSLARSPSGFSKSVNDLQGSFNAEIPKSGMERDYFTLLESDENAVVQARVRSPAQGSSSRLSSRAFSSRFRWRTRSSTHAPSSDAKRPSLRPRHDDSR